MAKSPDQIVADIDRQQNEEDRDLIPRAGRMLSAKLDEDLTGGAYTGARLNMPSNTPVGKLSAEDTRLYNKSMNQINADKRIEAFTGKKSKSSSMASKYGMKKGGSVSSASKRADGIATKGKTRGKMC